MRSLERAYSKHAVDRSVPRVLYQGYVCLPMSVLCWSQRLQALGEVLPDPLDFRIACRVVCQCRGCCNAQRFLQGCKQLGDKLPSMVAVYNQRHSIPQDYSLQYAIGGDGR